MSGKATTPTEEWFAKCSCPGSGSAKERRPKVEAAMALLREEIKKGRRLSGAEALATFREHGVDVPPGVFDGMDGVDE